VLGGDRRCEFSRQDPPAAPTGQSSEQEAEEEPEAHEFKRPAIAFAVYAAEPATLSADSCNGIEIGADEITLDLHGHDRR
jgi:hypothetical protein